MAKNKQCYSYSEAQKILEELNLFDYSGLELVFNVWKTETNPTTDEELNFCTKFVEGSMDRPSVRISGETKTKPDKVIDQVISGRIKNISDKNAF